MGNMRMASQQGGSNGWTLSQKGIPGNSQMERGMAQLVRHLEQQIQHLIQEGRAFEEQARQLLCARLAQVHTLQDEVQQLRAQLAMTPETTLLQSELERLHKEVEVWRQQHAALHLAWDADRRALDEWKRRWSQRQRVGQLAQQLHQTMSESACS